MTGREGEPHSWMVIQFLHSIVIANIFKSDFDLARKKRNQYCFFLFKIINIVHLNRLCNWMSPVESPIPCILFLKIILIHQTNTLPVMDQFPCISEDSTFQIVKIVHSKTTFKFHYNYSASSTGFAMHNYQFVFWYFIELIQYGRHQISSPLRLQISYS